jgi:hypothetical protein
MAALLISILLGFFFFFVDGVFEASAAMAGDGVARAGDGVIVGAGVIVVEGVAVDVTEGGRARCRDDDETGSNGTVAFVLERNVLAPREIFFMGECAPFSGVAWRIAGILPGSATSA